MSPATLISPAEYLSTTYRPDRELLDGQLVERNVGEYDRSNLQGALVAWMRSRQRERGIRVLPEQRIRIGEGRFRIPDICVVSRAQRVEPVFTEAPLLCVEILSKDDSLRSMQERIDDYISLGVLNIWILDPATRRAWTCSRGVLREPEGRVLEIPSCGICVPLDDLFADLD